MGEGMGVGMGEGSSLMGERHFPKLNPGTSRVMVGALLALFKQLSPCSCSFLGFRGSRTSTMIWDEDLVGDIEGEEEVEAPA